jgi:hypothetical protein
MYRKAAALGNVTYERLNKSIPGAYWVAGWFATLVRLPTRR